VDVTGVMVAVVGGIIAYYIAGALIDAIIKGTSASDVIMQTILPLVCAAGVLIVVMMTFMGRKRGE